MPAKFFLSATCWVLWEGSIFFFYYTLKKADRLELCCQVGIVLLMRNYVAEEREFPPSAPILARIVNFFRNFAALVNYER